VVLDKTGTLTVGAPRVVDIVAADAASVLALAASLEKTSEHPIARAILAAAKQRGVRVPRARDAVVTPGVGVSATIDGARCEIRAHAAAFNATDAAVTRLDVLRDGAVLGTIGVDDEVRPSARDAVLALQARGLRVAMLTGDASAPALRIASLVGIASDDVTAGASPAGKVGAVRALQTRGTVAMVGDGINDAAALAQADVGIALASGTDIARAAADFTLMRGDLVAIAQLHSLARAAVSTMRRNLFWALAYNVAALPIAAGALSSLGVVMNPVVASACMSLSSVSVVLSSLWLGRRRGVS
jgi:P-type E1-E2 ATPase